MFSLRVTPGSIRTREPVAMMALLEAEAGGAAVT